MSTGEGDGSLHEALTWSIATRERLGQAGAQDDDQRVGKGVPDHVFDLIKTLRLGVDRLTGVRCFDGPLVAGAGGLGSHVRPRPESTG